MRPNTHFQAKKNQIIQISLDLFLEKGYEATNISEIMERAKLSKGGMYHYFTSKENILDAVINHVFEELDKKIKLRLATAPSIEKKIEILLCADFLLTDEFIQKFISFKQEQNNSIVNYKVLEKNMCFGFRHLENIILDGIKQNIFQTKFPTESAEFLWLIGSNLFNKPTKDTTTLKQRLDAFIYFIQVSLKASDPFCQNLKIIFQNLIPNKFTNSSNL